ncbi:hypothetical protein MLD38_026366 [Melastoma candidum]|uniref:Uncharacterized protein n=1 Tax=Melastoma candidum TaxID=119954 RepID=A0ACB9P177_9MYRT|nr:hypothetical protein MLD38_026366 [Melastoma candidum]
MLRIPEHQVAGHYADGDKAGPLVDDRGRFYKPLQGDERGVKEVAFYESFSSNHEIPQNIRKFFPVFHGTEAIEASNGSGPQPHLVLEDVVANHQNPSVMDIKVGARTWYPQASEDYFRKCIEKDRGSTTMELGFRVSGLKVYGKGSSGIWKPGKKFVQSFTRKDVKLVLKNFVSSNLPTGSSLNPRPDCCFASTVYGGILFQLLELKKWFETQTMYHFCSSSVLLFFGQGSSLAQVKLVDFAHVIDGDGVIDHNFLGGLCSLIKHLSDILDEAGKGNE